MKKLVLLPNSDTVIICLPDKWIGIPIVCILKPIKKTHIKNDEFANKIIRKKNPPIHEKKNNNSCFIEE